MGAAASIASHPLCSAAAAVCPSVGLAAGVFVAGVALGATAAVCPPVVIAAVFGARAVFGAAFQVKATHVVATDFDAVVSTASETATGCLRVVKNAACLAYEGATKRFARSAECHGAKKEAPGTERSSYWPWLGQWSAGTRRRGSRIAAPWARYKQLVVQ